MDKEAQEHIGYFLSVAQKIGKNRDYLNVRGSARALLNQLEQLGYRKLPKDKPPLLRDEEITEVSFCKTMGRYKEVAQAQREADIKWYES